MTLKQLRTEKESRKPNARNCFKYHYGHIKDTSPVKPRLALSSINIYYND